MIVEVQLLTQILLQVNSNSSTGFMEIRGPKLLKKVNFLKSNQKKLGQSRKFPLPSQKRLHLRKQAWLVLREICPKSSGSLPKRWRETLIVTLLNAWVNADRALKVILLWVLYILSLQTLQARIWKICLLFTLEVLLAKEIGKVN